jgi:hypothetical protein
MWGWLSQRQRGRATPHRALRVLSGAGICHRLRAEPAEVVERVRFDAVDDDALAPGEMRHVARRLVAIGPVWARPFEAAEKAALATQRPQACFDRGAGACRVDQVRARDVPVVAHGPRGHVAVPDHLLPEEVGSAEVAVAIGERRLGKHQSCEPAGSTLRAFRFPHTWRAWRPR